MLSAISHTIDILSAMHYGLSILSMLSESLSIKYSRRFRSFRVHLQDIRVHVDRDGYQIWRVGAPEIEFSFNVKEALADIATSRAHAMIDALGAAVQAASMSFRASKWEALEAEIESSFLLPLDKGAPLRYVPCGQAIQRPQTPGFSGLTA